MQSSLKKILTPHETIHFFLFPEFHEHAGVATMEEQPKGRMIKLDLVLGSADFSLVCPIVLFKDDNFPEEWGEKPKIFSLQTGSVGCRSSGTLYIVLYKTGLSDVTVANEAFR
jgi:hypothetical protein